MSLYTYGQKWGLVAANLMRKLWASATAPTSPVTGEIYLDISASPYLLKRYNGATWDIVGTVAPEKCTGTEINNGTDDAKFATPFAIATSFLKSGWIPDGATWTYSSDDAPTYVISVNADMTEIISPGMRLKLTHAAAVKYFIVTAVGVYSGGVTLITVYGGTDYTLAATAITLPFYSSLKVPFGFPANPTKWMQTISDTSVPSQSNPQAGVWYNLGSLSIVLPIGAWTVSYKLVGQAGGANGEAEIITTLSTAYNSESDSRFTGYGRTDSITMFSFVFAQAVVGLVSKTTYYLNARQVNVAGTTGLLFRGNMCATTITAICAYL